MPFKQHKIEIIALFFATRGFTCRFGFWHLKTDAPYTNDVPWDSRNGPDFILPGQV